MEYGNINIDVLDMCWDRFSRYFRSKHIGQNTRARRKIQISVWTATMLHSQLAATERRHNHGISED